MTPSNEDNVLQSDFSATPEIGVAGGCPTDGAWEAPGDTKQLESASVGFGLAVSRGTERDTGIVIGGSEFVGITKAKQGQNIVLQASNDIARDHYVEGENVPVHVWGDIFVRVATDVVAGNPGWYNTTTGAISTGVGAGKALISGSQFMTSALSGKIARLRLTQAAGNETV